MYFALFLMQASFCALNVALYAANGNPISLVAAVICGLVAMLVAVSA